MNFVWSIGLITSLLFIVLFCPEINVVATASNSIFTSLELCLQLGVIYIFWCGVLEIVQALNLHTLLAKILQKPLNKLFPKSSTQAQQEIATNLSCNMLGLSNASLPCGIQALHKLKNTEHNNLLIILNCISLQILPTTIMSLYLNHGGALFIKIWLLSVVICVLILIFAIFLNLIFKRRLK